MTRDNWQEMVTDEIKTHFRKANRQVDKKWMDERKEKEEHQQEDEAGRGASPSLSVWSNADFFKRIVHGLANLPAASTAEHGANVMRGRERSHDLPTCLLPEQQGRWTCSLMKDGLSQSSLNSPATAWSTGRPQGHPSTDWLHAPNAYFMVTCFIQVIMTVCR